MEIPSSGSILETPHARLAVGATGAEVVLPLPDGRVIGYAPEGESPAAAAELAIDPFLRGNQFRVLHQSPRTLVALLSIAAGRRVDTGPESERVFVFLRGPGLVFAENGDTMRFAPGMAAVVPAGEPAKLWAQGPEDALLVVLQPAGQRVERRTLKSELEKRKLA